MLIGSSSIHTNNYYNLIKSHFSQIFLITDKSKDNLRIENVEYVSFSYKPLLNFITTTKKIKSVCEKFKPDVIHIHQVNSVALLSILAVKSFNIPIVLTAWGSDILITPQKNWILKQIVKYCLNKASVITADSEYVGKEVLKYVSNTEHKIVIANFGMDVYDENNLEKENVIYSNRLHKKLYNIDKIIHAFKKLNDKNKNQYKLVIGAVGEETEKLKRLVSDLNLNQSIEFVGWLTLEDNLKWYRKSKFYISIPDSDATSISLLEAMYYGCYPIVSSLPSTHEWIQENVNGNYFNTDINFIADLKQEKIDKAISLNKKIIMEKGTKAVAFEKFTQIYDTLTNK